MNEKSKSGGVRVFYTLILTQVLSLIGTQISGLAIGIWVYTETGDATPLALVAFFTFLPKIIAGSVSGVLADRLDRRYLMALADGGQAVGTVLLLISFASGSFELWHLYVVALIQGLFSVFQGPAFTASITMLVPDDQRDRANTLVQLTQPSAGIIAPALAGFIFALFGVIGALFIDILTFIVAVIVVLNVQIPRPRQTQEGMESKTSILDEVLGGIRYLLQRRPLFYALLYMMMLNLFFGGLSVILTPYVLARTGSETTLGIILSLLNFGALVGGIGWSIISGKRKFPRMKVMIFGILFVGLMVIGIGMSQSAFGIGTFIFIMLLPIPAVNASLSSLFQAKVAPDIQGRVFAVAEQLATFLMPISYLMIGPLVDQVFEPGINQPEWDTFAPIWGNEAGAGMGLLMSIVGVISVVVSLIALSYPSLREVDKKLPDYVSTEDAEDETESDTSISHQSKTA